MSIYQVIIAEDEPLIRNGIAESIEWNHYSTALAGMAKNGVQALELIKSKHVDILITDIQMPAMDGLALIKAAIQHNPALQVLVISGYSNFTYAQNAITMGVREYILKPIKIDQLKEALKRIVVFLDEERGQQQKLSQYETFFEEFHPELSKGFFQDLLFGSLTPIEIERKSKLLSPKRVEDSYLPLVVFLETHTFFEQQQLLETLRQHFESFHKEHQLELEHFFSFTNENLFIDVTLLFTKDTASTTQLNPHNFYEVLRTITGFSLLGLGFGSPCVSLTDLPSSYQFARIQAFLTLLNGSVFFTSHSQIIQSYPSLTEAVQRIASFVEANDPQLFETELMKLEKEIKQYPGKIHRAHLKVYLASALMIGERRGFAVKTFFPSLSILHQYSLQASVDELHSKVIGIIKSLESPTPNALYPGKALMKKAHEYLSVHYTDHTLSIEQVSTYLGITPSYFSRLCKQSLGKTYTEHLMSLRMNKALELLRSDPPRKISSISKSVGFGSPSYFNYCFKKLYNITPKEYQNGLEPIT